MARVLESAADIAAPTVPDDIAKAADDHVLVNELGDLIVTDLRCFGLTTFCQTRFQDIDEMYIP